VQSNLFTPSVCLRNAYAQTFLASAKFRAWGKNDMASTEKSIIIHTTDGVRLLGYHSRHFPVSGKGLVVLLHGWEGSSDSTYILTSGRHLFNQGFDIFRLNLRDHGPSHHLNSGLFYAVLLDEVFQAIQQISEEAMPRPVFLTGFSLGGNFTLRIARKCQDNPISNFKHAVAISPVLDPSKATDRIDENRFIRKYFLKKWRRSLSVKQRLYPGLYDFSELMTRDNIRSMTEILLKKYSSFSTANEYFSGYAVLDDALKSVELPLTIITSADDPIIPVADFYRLEHNPATRLMIHQYGGHNGFLQDVRLTGWYEMQLVDMFNEYLK